MVRIRRWTPAFVLLAIAAGCSSSEVPLYPVKGTVLYKGKPVPRAEMTFHPQFEGPGWMPVAVVAEDGTFAAGTRLPGDGALAGKYKVTIAWRPVVNADGEGPNVLPARFADAKVSPLEVEAGPDIDELRTLTLAD